MYRRIYLDRSFVPSLGAVVVAFVFATAAILWPIRTLAAEKCPRTHVLLVGDSIIEGKGDQTGRGGVSGRIREAIPNVDVRIISRRGAKSNEMLEYLSTSLSRGESDFTYKTKDIDLVVIAVGTNDFWNDRAPQRTVEDIRSIATLLNDHIKKVTSVTPTIGIATLAPTTLPAQQRWLRHVNSLMTSHTYQRLPVRLRFDRMPMTLLGPDGIHPSSKGHDWLAQQVVHFLLSPGGIKRSETGTEHLDSACLGAFLASPDDGPPPPTPISKRPKKSRRPSPGDVAPLTKVS